MVGRHCGRPMRGGLRRYMDGGGIGGSLGIPAGAGRATLTPAMAWRPCRVAPGMASVHGAGAAGWRHWRVALHCPLCGLTIGHRRRTAGDTNGRARPGVVTTVRQPWVHGAVADMSRRCRFMLIRVVLRSGPVGSVPRSGFSSANPAGGVARDVTERLRPLPHVSAACWGARLSTVGP